MSRRENRFITPCLKDCSINASHTASTPVAYCRPLGFSPGPVDPFSISLLCCAIDKQSYWSADITGLSLFLQFALFKIIFAIFSQTIPFLRLIFVQYQFQKLEFTQQLAEQSPIVLHTDNFRKPSLSST